MDETTLQQMLTTYSCIDNPSAQDYPFDKYLAMIEGQVGVGTLTKRPYSQWIAFNQGQVGACTFYGPTLANNGQQINAFNSQSLTYTQIDPMTLWVKQQIHTYAILDGLNFLKTYGIITGFTIIPRCEQTGNDNRVSMFKKAIDMGNYIVTGATGLDYGAAFANPQTALEFTTTGFYATASHCFNLIDYNDVSQEFTMAGSFGAERGDKGYAYIKYSDVWRLMSAYALINKDDSGIFAKFKNKQKASQIVDLLHAFWKVELESTTQNLMGQTAQQLRNEYDIPLVE